LYSCMKIEQWNCSKKEGEGMKENDGGGKSNYIIS
jgi:hypothetical protein